MDEQSPDYAVGYGRPPVEGRFQKGRSGNPAGRRREKKKMVTLLGEALSRRSGYPKPDGAWMTQAEVIFTGLVAQAAGSDLKAKKVLFDILIRLQQANICWPSDRLPEIEVDEGEDGQEVAATETDRLTETANGAAGASDEMPGECLPEAGVTEDADHGGPSGAR